ncbi:MAG: DtxR family transcriptional regulator, partial [Kiritimatiellae bacterium]|nr:DtxR family transcriptional regulator [Kiritimatiellia bacterium]
MHAMTQSLEDYLEAIYILVKEKKVACVRDVAKTLNVKMPSVVKAIHELKKLELVTQEP